MLLKWFSAGVCYVGGAVLRILDEHQSCQKWGGASVKQIFSPKPVVLDIG